MQCVLRLAFEMFLIIGVELGLALIRFLYNQSPQSLVVHFLDSLGKFIDAHIDKLEHFDIETGDGPVFEFPDSLAIVAARLIDHACQPGNTTDIGVRRSARRLSGQIHFPYSCLWVSSQSIYGPACYRQYLTLF